MELLSLKSRRLTIIFSLDFYDGTKPVVYRRELLSIEKGKDRKKVLNTNEGRRDQKSDSIKSIKTVDSANESNLIESIN